MTTFYHVEPVATYVTKEGILLTFVGGKLDCPAAYEEELKRAANDPGCPISLNSAADLADNSIAEAIKEDAVKVAQAAAKK